MSLLASSAQDVSHSIPGLSAYRLLPLMIVSIFLSETIIMFILNWLPEFPMVTEAFMDATMLLVILSPTFYFFHYRPLQTHHRERKAIVQKLIESEERLTLALDAVNDGLWDWDIPSNYFYVSPRWESMLGYQPGSLDPHIKTFKSLIHPDDQKRVQNEMEFHSSGIRNTFESEFRMKTVYQDWRWVLSRGKIVSRGPNGEPLRAVGTHTDIHSRKLAEEALQQSELSIRHLSRELIDQSETEKKRLAQDLHDDFGQLLTAFKLGIEMILDQQYKDRAELVFQSARLLGTVEYMESALRGICDNLRPVMLDDIGLVATLKWLTRELERQSGTVKINLDAGDLKDRLAPEVELVCYRICQEALNNCLKHASASVIDIRLSLGSQAITVKITDNGRGFDLNTIKDPARTHWGIGLLGMNERAAAINGHVNIDSAPGKGTKIELIIPFTAYRKENEWPVSA